MLILLEQITSPGSPHHHFASRQGNQQDYAGGQTGRHPWRFVTAADEHPPQTKKQRNRYCPRDYQVARARRHACARRLAARRFAAAARIRTRGPRKNMIGRVVTQSIVLLSSKGYVSDSPRL